MAPRKRKQEATALDSSKRQKTADAQVSDKLTICCIVSHRTREKYVGGLYVAAPQIKAIVKDFNFGHVIAFSDTLSAKRLEGLPNLSGPSLSRQLSFDIELTRACERYPDGLARWLRRCRHPPKKGTNINAEYAVWESQPPFMFTDAIYVNNFWKQPRRPTERIFPYLRCSERSAKGRERVETDKVEAALKRDLVLRCGVF
ncbi:hypothetical protein LTR37_016361 [Vermiconidia calcicola]|uniref:Uncharacterized protein n=1 Tax=Vermiconidia calcicola TaxID=1690605 RepID=A0ACC3MN35_9PEZI|nr:hypothetical protein LTR37_016361 [Vermiconidia calcicola]